MTFFDLAFIGAMIVGVAVAVWDIHAGLREHRAWLASLTDEDIISMAHRRLNERG